MRVAVIGGTGTLGSGIAMRLCGIHDVRVGSRMKEKGEAFAEELSRAGFHVRGGANLEVATECDSALVPVSYTPEMEVLQGLEGALAGKLVVSPVVPMEFRSGTFVYSKAVGSAAEQVAGMLPKSRVAAALHTIPAALLQKVEVPLDLDTFVTSDSKETFNEVAGLLAAMKGLRSLHAGPLSASRSVEQLTPLLLNIGKANGLKSPSIRLV